MINKMINNSSRIIRGWSMFLVPRPFISDSKNVNLRDMASPNGGAGPIASIMASPNGGAGPIASIMASPNGGAGHLCTEYTIPYCAQLLLLLYKPSSLLPKPPGLYLWLYCSAHLC